MANKYIDVRGVHPVLIDGLIATELTGLTRAVTVEQAEILLEDLRISGELAVMTDAFEYEAQKERE